MSYLAKTIEPKLTPAEIRQRADAWYQRQMAISEKALGTDWPRLKGWVSDYLKQELRERLLALGWRTRE